MSKSRKVKALTLFTAWVFALVSMLPLSAIPAVAQATTGTLRGVVADPNGAVVAGATVTAKSESTGTVTAPVTTSGEGTYEIPALLPGNYTVTVEAPGFKRAESTHVVIKLGIVNPLDVKLEAGAVTETVTVTANTEEVVQRDQSQISTTIATRQVTDLPSNGAGGGLDTLALLAPGVVVNRGGGVNTNGTGLSINGNRGRSNNFQIDGSDNNDLSVAGPAMFVDNQDQVQEYQIITNNFSAQYGRNQGAVVNIVTKSGTNQFHGSGFEFHQDNAALNSLDNIEKRSGQTFPTPSLYNVFGGSVGGPLYLPHFGEGGRSVISGKDRFFFFVTYQGIRNPASTILRSGSLAILPSDIPRLLATFPNNGAIQALATQDVFVIRPGAHPRTDISNPFATINLGGQTFQAAQPEFTIAIPFTETDYSTRFDLKLTKRDNVTVRYLKQSQDFVNNLVQTNGFSGDVIASSKNFGGDWTHQIGNSMVSEFRATYQRIGVVFGGGCSVNAPGCTPDVLQIGQAVANIAFPVVSGTRALQTIGVATNLPQGRVGKVYQIADNLSWTRGRHNFIFGGEYKHLNTVTPFLPNFNGVYSFSSVTRLLNNAPSGFSLTVGDPTLAFTENDQYYFVQDDFKIRPNLTLNLGLRYEYTGQPINILAAQSVARENDPTRRFYDPSLPLSVRTVPTIPADKNNFAPRVGFAWSPHFWKHFLGEDATVIRGGYSIAYDATFYNILLNIQNTAPFAAAFALPSNLLPSSNSPVPVPITGVTGDVIRASAMSSGVLPLGRLNPLFLSQTTVARNFRSPYSEQWSLGVQHQFGRNTVAEVRYVGTHGVGLFQNRNGNPFVQTLVNGIPTEAVCTSTPDPTTGNCTTTNVTFRSFANLIPAGITPLNCTNDPNTPSNESLCQGRILPQAGLTIRENSAQSLYHGMQARYNSRLLNNSLGLGAAYTFSKTIDNSSEIFAFDVASSFAQNPFCITKCERSLSYLDHRHALSMNFIYDVPFHKEQRGLIGHLLGGWQLNGVYVLTSGQRYTPGQVTNAIFGAGNAYITAGDRPFIGNPNADQRLVGINQVDAYNLGLIDHVTNVTGFLSLNQLNSTGNVVSVTPNDVRFIVNGPGAAQVFGTPFGNASRNSLTGPKLNQLNMGLFKNIKVREHLTVQLRGEAYNVLNHPNPGFGVNAAGYCPGCSSGFGGSTASFFVEDAGNLGSAFAENQDIELARRVIQVGIRVVF
jgi:outer membrane receptor protein involved in Fe transport